MATRSNAGTTPAYDPRKVFSSIDRGGLYACRNQPAIAQWNLKRFAETLLTLMDADREKAIATATEALEEWTGQFERYWLAGMWQKLGLQTDETGDTDLIQSFLD
ncbi:hypothetical protein BH10PLA2_BH10PLA2_12310 [soil metagenome]